MSKPSKQNEDARSNYEMDVERMMDEGLGGGYVTFEANHDVIEEARAIPKENEPYPTPKDK
ncbi:hypothetical protein N781_14745 [Pontibacillus halophilus JSM 076056 = DSM 19796]|uniref:Uncharacterized protein n=1 Tax=Pontibacillus halophilus JSM 076056 = DSM 19796 TaxID=1385510 RepID=A0A0A5I9T4_9BACI|nr:hypothetical protein [Pontibacillus halophilus]KGX92587.1 hypothetical protein N781_14745 [Pontibacillus halophilus JSM 076056 = DSM 19796]